MKKTIMVLLSAFFMLINVAVHANEIEKNEINKMTEFEKSLVGEWEYIIGGVSSGGVAFDNSIIGQKGTFTFFDNGEFELIESPDKENIEKGTFKETDKRIIRLYFENEKKYEKEVYLEFNDESNKNQIAWVIIQRDEFDKISEKNTVSRFLEIKQIK